MQSAFSQRCAKLLTEAHTRSEQVGLSVSGREWDWLLEFASGISKIDRLIGSEKAPRQDWEAVFEAGVRRRLLGEPIQYVVGGADFYGRSFTVGPAVLIPRPETELLVEWAVKVGRNQTNPKVVDIGTGSGCIAISVALELAGSVVSAVDISSSALSVARTNARLLGAAVDFSSVNILDAELPSRDYSLIVSNPPYVPVEERDEMQLEVRDFEPHVALFAGKDPLLFYKRFAETLQHHLRPQGWLGVEIHANYGQKVADLFEQHGWKNVNIKQDLAGKDRFVIASVD